MVSGARLPGFKLVPPPVSCVTSKDHSVPLRFVFLVSKVDLK